MAQAYPSAKAISPALATVSVRHVAISVLTLLFVGLLTFLSLEWQRPPSAVPANAPASEFSSGRAMQHLEVISRKPHPMGAAEHTAVRNYLLNELSAIGLQPEVQRALVIGQTGGANTPAATVYNVLAKLEGRDSQRAILLVAHYDTVPTSLGASDDGSGVVAILETMRALKATATLKNDVICLFTDGEEVGSTGARAFVEEHAWAKEVGLVLNFEARGRGGAALMFETSVDNGRLIEELARATQGAVTNSLFYDIYRTLPNDTDLSVFKRAGYPGFNFAFVDGHAHYHSLADNSTQIDERSLQHQGSYALSLTRHFGELDLGELRKRDAVFFNVPGLSLVHYSGAWSVPLAILTGTLFALMLFVGLKRRRLTLSGIQRGFVGLLLAMIASALLVSLAWLVIRAAHSGYGLILQGTTYNSELYAVGFVALTLALASLSFVRLCRKATLQDVLAGGLCWWLILMILSAMHMPGASYLFMWPLLSGLSVLGWMVRAGEQEKHSIKSLAIFYLGSVPAIVLVVPVVKLLFTVMPMGMAAAPVILLVLLVGLLVAPLKLLSQSSRWFLPGASLAVALVFIAAGSLTSAATREHPRPNNIFYCLNADSGEAVWASTDEKPDEWTTQFFDGSVQRGALNDYVSASGERFLKQRAPSIPLASPDVTLLSDETSGGVRRMRLRITSQRRAPFLRLGLNAEAKVLSATLDGKQVTVPVSATGGRAGGWGFFYYAPPFEGIELALEVEAASQPLKMRVEDQSFELPEALMAAHKPRPDYMIPTPFPYNIYGDSTFVSKSFSF